MISVVARLCIGSLAAVVSGDEFKPVAPKSVDSRLIFERIAAEPEIVTPTGITVDGRGRVLVIESHTHFRPPNYAGPPADRIRVFEDRDRDGKAECTGTFFEGTRMTMNLRVAGDGSVFVATRSALYRLWDRDDDGRADGIKLGSLPAPFVRLDTPGDYPHNGLSGFAFDFAGNVYFGLGENLGAEYRIIGSDGVALSGGGEGGNIYRCRPDGSKLERVATGFWNPFHMTFDVFGRLFAVDNDPDSRPPCRLLHIVQGGDYGYRFRNGRKGVHPFTSWNGELPGTLGMVAGTGEAPSGVVEYNRESFPADYSGALLVTSWGDHRIERYRLKGHGASFQATMEPVVTGDDDFRPVGIAIAPDGSVYVSDWVDKSYTLHGKGRLWRLRHAGANAGERQAPAIANAWREAASGLAAAAGAGKIDRQLTTSVLHSRSADVRAFGVSILPAEQAGLKDAAATDPSPLVRAAAMRRLSDSGAKDTLLKAFQSDDPFIQQAARLGLRNSMRTTELVTLAGSKDLSAEERLALLLILRESDRSEAEAALPALLADADPRVRFAAIQWVGEHRLTQYRTTLQAALASSANARDLFEATLAALERLDGKTRSLQDEIAGEDYVAALVKDERTSAAVLEQGLRMLRPDHPVLTLDRFKRLLGDHSEAVRLEALKSLCQSPRDGRFEILARLAGDDRASLPIRAEAIAGLAEKAATHHELLLSLASGKETALRHEALRSLRGVRLDEGEQAKLRKANRDDADGIALVEFLEKWGTPDHAQSGGTDDPRNEIDAILAQSSGSADPAAGERVFFHARGPGCYRCHQVQGRGSRAGPDLTSVPAGMTQRRLIESIVSPNKEIAPQFVAYAVARNDGTVFSGILLGQSPDGGLIFADSQGRKLQVKTSEIAERKPQTISIMPEGLARAMTKHEMRDLVAFLLRRK